MKPTVTQRDLQDSSKICSILDGLFNQAIELARESKQWPIIYKHGAITTRKKTSKSSGSNTSKNNNQHAYIQRSSIHSADQATYDQLRSLLYLNHSLNETKYVKQLADAILLEKVNDEADLVWLGFKTPAPCSNREFVELVATREEQNDIKSFMVVSQPVEFNKIKKGYVRGAYQAWEIVSEIENEKGDKAIEWICIQRSSAGGLIPSFVSDLVAAKDFHHDVEGIIKYIQENK